MKTTSCNTYNAYSEEGYDPDFGRTYFTEVSHVKNPPFYACPMTWAVLITNCGVNIDWDTYEVLSEKTGEPIPGLYAIGELTATGGGLNVMSQGVKVVDAIIDKAQSSTPEPGALDTKQAEKPWHMGLLRYMARQESALVPQADWGKPAQARPTSQRLHLTCPPIQSCSEVN